MREKILTFIEKNSRVDLADLAVMLGVESLLMKCQHSTEVHMQIVI